MEPIRRFSLFFAIFLGIVEVINGDTPGNCTFEDVSGTWKFSMGKAGSECATLGPVSKVLTLKLRYPDEAVDEFGNVGFWTMVYNQGFEVVINGRKYFAFSKYEGTLQNSTSFCDQTMVGWSHDVMGHNWACYQGQKVNLMEKPRPKVQILQNHHSERLYQHDMDFIEQINSMQSSWKAVHYPEYERMTLQQMTRRAGGRKTIGIPKPSPAPVSEDARLKAASLPAEFDWRNVDGQNYVSPVRSQGQCGSCFAFASMAMNEARLQIVTKNQLQVTLSPQDIVDCSPYSQGCDGGFPYLVAGKYAEDFGLVEEACNPYQGSDQGVCKTNKNCTRHYSTNYRYIGGYYGGSNEAEMMLALHANGPIVIGFEVYPDLQAYKGGVYQHTGLLDKYNPFEITNHAVLLTGWGVDEATGLKYWSIKNSWGQVWGEQGYFRILRGADECAVESCTVESTPIMF